MPEISLKTVLWRFKWPIFRTNLMVVLESILGVLIPLFIGWAINDLLAESLQGIYRLAILGVSFIAISTIRRFHDTRVYSAIYKNIVSELLENEQEKGSTVSKMVARTQLLAEIVDFLEWSIPAVVGSVIYLLGVLVIIFTLNLNVFFASVLLLLLVLAVYGVTGKISFKLNESYNNELEKEVTILETRNQKSIKAYFGTLMRWNIKLADLETFNYLLVMVGIGALFIYTPITVVKSGEVYYGLIFSVVLYVFEYVGALVALPDHIQQVIRLTEISSRLSE
jgi:ABC-type multidrug transport system fused ATPase/permease subunit